MECIFCFMILFVWHLFSAKHLLVLFAVLSIANVSCVSLTGETSGADEVEKNAVKELLSLYKFCDMGDLNACNQLGDRYLKGDGVASNKADALEWYKKACIDSENELCRLLRPEQSKYYDDWFVVCDSAVDCRAAGYQPDGHYASLMVYRSLENRSGHFSAAIRTFIDEGDYNYDPSCLEEGSKSWTIGGVVVSPLKSEAEISRSTKKLKGANDSLEIVERKFEDAHNNSRGDIILSVVELKKIIEQSRQENPQSLIFDGGCEKFEISLRGLYDAVEHIDLLQKFTKNEELPSRKLSISSTAIASNDLTAKDKSGVIEEIESFCNQLKSLDSVQEFRLRETEYLIVVNECWMAAYNSGGAAYHLSVEDGTYVIKEMYDFTEFNIEGGVINLFSQPRGGTPYQCFHRTNTVWTGEKFLISEESIIGKCKGSNDDWFFPVIFRELDFLSGE